MKKHIAILFGGKSGEHEVSLQSAYCVYHALDLTKYDVSLIGIDKSGRWVLVSPSLFKKSDKPRAIDLSVEKEEVSILPLSKNLKKPDLILPILHGTNGEDGTIQGLIELSGIGYVGAGVLSSSVCMDKDVSKRLLRDAGIPVVPFLTIQRSDYKKNPELIHKAIEKEFKYPVFVKPVNMGSSVGVGKIKSAAECREKIENAFLYDTKILIEKGVAAREIECAVLGNHDPKASIIGEIVPNHEFYSYEAKYIDQNGADLHIPAKNLSPELTRKIQDHAIASFKALECSGMARVDFFLDRNTNELYLNELNTIPGFTPISMYPKLWDATGLPYAQLLDRLIELGFERFEEKAALKTTYEPIS